MCKSLEERRRQLLPEYAKGTSNRETVNRLLKLADSNAERDLGILFIFAPTSALRLLRRKLRNDQVIRGSYKGPDGTGCLCYFLLGVRSNEQMLNYPEYDSAESLDAVARVVRHWDYGALDEETVARILDETLRQRAELNALEEAAIHRAAENGLALATEAAL